MAEAATDVAVRRGTDATPGTARPLMLKPGPTLVTVAPVWKIDPAIASGPVLAVTVLRLPKKLKAKLAPGRPAVAAVTTLSLPRMLTATVK